MISQMWLDILGFEDFEEPLVLPDEIDDVVALMLEMKIDPQKFCGNLMAILRQGRRPFDEAFLGKSQPFITTPSAKRYTSVLDRPASTPLWVLAGFPDVHQWLVEKIVEWCKPPADEEAGERRTMELYGIDLNTAQNADEAQFWNCNGSLRVCYYRNLISNYRKETGNILEVSVVEGSENDIYKGKDLLDALNEDSNFTLMAGITTRYYVELKRSYGHRFPDEASLLATSGILHGHIYVFQAQTIKPEQIIAIAKATKDSTDRLLDFIIRLETLFLSVDAPEFPFEEVESACKEQAVTIKNAIDRAINSYDGQPDVVDGVQVFMKSSQLSQIRKDLGIRGK